MKKLVTLLLALVMMASLFSAMADYDGLPIADGDVTLKIFIVQPEGYPSGFEGIAQAERFAKETGLNLVWDTIPAAAWQERKSIMIASGDLPDIIAGGGVTVDEQIDWASKGLLLELTPYIDEYMPRLNEIFADHPDYRDQLKLPDGSIYALPHGAMIDFGCRGNLIYMHEDWLKAAGVEYDVREESLYRVIENEFTIDEFTDILYAMKDITPEGCYPLSGTYTDINIFNELFGAFGQVDNTDHIIVKDGEVIFTAWTDEWRNAIEYLGKLYTDGIIDPEVFSQDYNMFLAKASQEFPMFGCGLVWTAHQFDNDMGEAYDKWLLVKPVGDEDGNFVWGRSNMGVGTGIYLVTTACEHPVEAVKFYDYMQEEDNAMQLSMGEFGTSLVKNADGTYDMLTYETVMPTGLNMMFIGTPESYAKVHFADPTQMTIDVGMEYRVYQPAVATDFPIVAWNNEDQDALSKLQADIKPFVAQKSAEWIKAGSVSDEEWNDFVAELEKMGAEEYLTIYQDKLASL